MKVENRIVDFIRERTKASSGIVVGLSGGIDSAVVLALSARALGNRRVTALIMPEHEVTKLSDVHDAERLSAELKIKSYIYPIDGILSAIARSQPFIRDDKKAFGNAKARARMILLYAYANRHNYLVAGTGNKSELLTGYFTKYGDGATDFLPIADMYKTDVIKLARQLNIPRAIINKKPSAGLWRGQNDEEELGISYKLLDRILKGETKGISPDKIKRIKKLIEQTQHKRLPPEICRLS